MGLGLSVFQGTVQEVDESFPSECPGCRRCGHRGSEEPPEPLRGGCASVFSPSDALRASPDLQTLKASCEDICLKSEEQANNSQRVWKPEVCLAIHVRWFQAEVLSEHKAHRAVRTPVPLGRVSPPGPQGLSVFTSEPAGHVGTRTRRERKQHSFYKFC